MPKVYDSDRSEQAPFLGDNAPVVDYFTVVTVTNDTYTRDGLIHREFSIATVALVDDALMRTT